jgi:iron(III) transport system ATP-binding protein
MTALALARITHHFGALRALDEASLTVSDGEIVCILGPSGCGKSTLLRIAAGLEPLQSGKVSIGGRIVAEPGRRDAPPEQRNIGFLFQDFALFPHLTALENAAFGLLRLPAERRQARALAALEKVGMEDYASAYPHTLSGGQQQRVALARAMAPEPGLFLLDEPFSGLDARLRRRLLEDTWRLLKFSGAASVIVTHDPEEAMLLGDRVAVMRAGRILQDDTPEAIYRHPNSAFVAEILSEVNKFRGIVDEHGSVETPLGCLDAGGYPPGTRVVVIVRQSAVSLHLDDTPAGTVPVAINWARPMGALSLVQLERRNRLSPSAAGEAGGDVNDSSRVPIYARLANAQTLRPGDLAHAATDHAEVFVFPAEPPT